MAVFPRETCYVDPLNNEIQRCYSPWSNWGRWVAFAIIVGGAFIIFFIFAFLSARARRRRGLHPYTGTAWMAPPAYNAQEYHNPPPQYSPNPNQGYYGRNQGGYYGGQQTGIELQQPPNVYHGDDIYPPPASPPPGKK